MRDPWDASQRPPDDQRVHVPWNIPFVPNMGKVEPRDTPLEYTPDNGILDHLFDGLEDEIERVNRKLGL